MSSRSPRLVGAHQPQHSEKIKDKRRKEKIPYIIYEGIRKEEIKEDPPPINYRTKWTPAAGDKSLHRPTATEDSNSGRSLFESTGSR